MYFQKNNLSILLLALLSFSTLSEEFLKVEVTATNNYQTSTVEHPKELMASQDPNLTSYVFERIQFRKYTDPGLFIEVMDWVASQWKHDSFNQAPSDMSSLEILKSVHEKGERYRCVEYGKVMADILSSMGHYSRQIGLRSTDVAYGGWGKGHVATEVWSNSMNKWVFFDPQFSIYALFNEEYLNIHDIFLLKTQGKFEQIEFVTTPKYAASNDIDINEAASNYKLFLSHYLGFHASSRYIHGEKQSVYLMMEADTPALTFQGMGSKKKTLFTKQPSLAYPQINQTIAAITALPNENSNFEDIFEEFDIQTEEQYLSNMWRFAAKGEVSMTFTTNMNDFSRYQVKENNQKWSDLDNNEFVWKLIKGGNRFEIRSVSKNEVFGPTTFIDIDYN